MRTKAMAVALLTLGGSVAAIAPAANAATASYYLGDTKPYQQPVTMTIGWPVAGNQGLPSGQSQENNDYVKYIDKTLNVNLQYSWLSPTSDTTYQKASLAISSGDIPDVMQVNYQLLKQLEAANMIEPLTTAYNQNASGFVKEYYKDAGNRPLKMATYKGQLMALPDVQIGYQYDMLWVRKDWLQKLHLQPPKTLNDVANIAKAFIKAKLGGSDTVGIIGRPQISNYFQGATFDSIFSALGAYPGQWFEKNGKVYYGSVQPQVKSALSLLSNWYSQGLIDPQFATRSANDEIALANTGKAGIFIVPWWVTWGDLTPTLDKDWAEYAAPLDKNGKMNVVAPAPSGSFIVVKKGFKNPGAVVKVLNLSVAGYRDRNPATNNLYKRQNVQWTQWPLSIDLDYYDAIPRKYNDVATALKTHSTTKLSPDERQIYFDVAQYRSNPKNNLNLWPEVQAYTTAAGGVYNSEHVLNQVQPLTLVPDPSLAAKASALQTLESQTFLGIVVGQYPLSKFDQFVQEWHALGGDQMTATYQAQVKGN